MEAFTLERREAMRTRVASVICILLCACLSFVTLAGGQDLEEWFLFSDEDVVAAASRHEESLTDAPAAATACQPRFRICRLAMSIVLDRTVRRSARMANAGASPALSLPDSMHVKRLAPESGCRRPATA